ncbi:MAG: methylmalonyl-CoA mutase family protein [Bacteroidia bacterium]|nr:methylmalonyl-CoA mutase family protein [Bacteroidia bacterium]
MQPQQTSPLLEEFSAATAEAWAAQMLKDLKGKPLSVLDWQTGEGISLRPAYHPDEFRGREAELGAAPGTGLFRRGNLLNAAFPGWQPVLPVHPAGPEAGLRIREALHAGIHAFFLTGETGPTDEWLRGLPFGEAALHLHLSEPPAMLARELYLAMEADQTAPDRLTGTLFNDPISVAAAMGKTASPHALALAEGAVPAFGHSPHFRAIGLDFSYVHEQGGTVTQQLAFALSTLVDYLSHLNGPDTSRQERFLRNLSVTFATGSYFFLEIAKLRAFRVLLARALDVMDLTQPELQSPFIIARTARWNKARYDAHTNLLRASTETLSAVLGGAHAVVTHPFNELNQINHPHGLRLARNIQFLLQHESYLDQVQDAAGGSYYIEAATDSLADAAWRLFQDIEGAGGFTEAVRSGKVGELIRSAAELRRTRLAERKQSLIGINQYPNPDEALHAPLPDESDPRAAAPFETLRLRHEQAAERSGRRFSAYLLTFGDLAMRNARAAFSRNLLACAGIPSTESGMPDHPEEAIREAAGLRPDLVVLCSADDAYFSQGEALLQAVRAALPGALCCIAGKPAGIEALGADESLYAGMNAVEFLSRVLTRLQA